MKFSPNLVLVLALDQVLIVHIMLKLYQYLSYCHL